MDKESLLRKYLELFVHRRDVHAQQTDRGTYYLVRRAVDQDLIEKHLRGKVTCGFYALNQQNTVRWVCVDADTSDGLYALQSLWARLWSLQMPSYIESSRRGGHLWVFLEPISAKVVRRLISGLICREGLEGLELYPKQDSLTADGVGNLVRGPLGIHRLSGKRYPFVDPVELRQVGLKLIDQFDYLMTFERVSVARVAEALVEVLDSEPERTHQAVSEDHGDIALIKKRIDIYDFVSQYVQLDAKGRGCCPFHDDHRPSFSVNREGGYWNCFAGCGGGDVIHFYERYHGVSRGVAIRALLKMCE